MDIEGVSPGSDYQSNYVIGLASEVMNTETRYKVSYSTHQSIRADIPLSFPDQEQTLDQCRLWLRAHFHRFALVTQFFTLESGCRFTYIWHWRHKFPVCFCERFVAFIKNRFEIKTAEYYVPV